MNDKGLSIVKLKDSVYGNVVDIDSENAVYCELRYQRDRSSFAGVALKVSGNNNVFNYIEIPEMVVEELNKYENVYIGCNEEYIKSVEDVFYSKTREYGIDVLFLVYSEVRSSQMIFEELMKSVVENIEGIREINYGKRSDDNN